MRHRRWLLSDIIHDYCQLTLENVVCEISRGSVSGNTPDDSQHSKCRKISLNAVGRFVFNDAIRTIWRWGGQGLWIPYPRGSTPYTRPYFPPLFLVQNSDFFRFHHPRPSDPRRFGVIGSWSLVCEFNFIITHIDSAQFSQLPSQSSGAYWQPEKVGSTETWLRSCCRSCVRIFQELSSSLIYGRTDGSKA